MKRISKNRLLIISRNVPPRYSGTSVVIENLSKGFESDELIVIGEKLLGIKNEISGEFRVKLKYNTFSVNANRMLTGLLRKVQIVNGLIVLLYLVFKFRPNKIIIVYPSAEYLFMGYLLSKLYKCDYYSYFHNTYFENRKGYKKRIANWLQNKIFKLSKIVFLISDGMLNYYKVQYPEYDAKFITLVHSFIEDIPGTVDVKINGKVKLAFAGNINESCKDAAERMLKALSELENVEFHIFSPSLLRTYFLNIGIKNESLECYPTMDRKTFINKLREFDIMLLPHGFSGNLTEIEYETIFPTKTIEYLISGKPILYHGPTNSYLTDFLRTKNCSWIVDKIDGKEIQNGLNKLIENKSLREQLVKNALNTAKRFHIKKVINELKVMLIFKD